MPSATPFRAFAVATLLVVAPGASRCAWTDGVIGGEDAPAVESPAPLSPPTFGTSADTWPAGVVTFTTSDGEAVDVSVRIADDPQRRRQGLMGVEEVPPGTGMLFVFPSPREGGFWMKDTPVALDIAYIAAGEVVSVMQMEPCVDYQDASSDCPSYDPGMAYDATVEVAQGWFGAQGIGEGATVTTTGGVPTR